MFYRTKLRCGCERLFAGLAVCSHHWTALQPAAMCWPLASSACTSQSTNGQNKIDGCNPVRIQVLTRLSVWHHDTSTIPSLHQTTLTTDSTSRLLQAENEGPFLVRPKPTYCALIRRVGRRRGRGTTRWPETGELNGVVKGADPIRHTETYRPAFVTRTQYSSEDLMCLTRTRRGSRAATRETRADSIHQQPR